DRRERVGVVRDLSGCVDCGGGIGRMWVGMKEKMRRRIGSKREVNGFGRKVGLGVKFGRGRV
ncbi:hypothetical protein, partial [Bacillus pumilus]|uniref:hypothetical protein n=1 Tax=Bacillus pumilus TaxID=1408 RepID=UPI001C92F242